MTLVEQVQSQIKDRFPRLSAEERELLAGVISSVANARYAEGLLDGFKTVAPYISNELRPAAAFIISRAVGIALCEEKGGVS